MKYFDFAVVLTRFFRKRRLRNLRILFPPSEHPRVLDIGGTPAIWEMLDYPSEVTLVNPNRKAFTGHGKKLRLSYVNMVGDGRHLQCADKSYDLAFANSVIEHVGGEVDAAAFASEMRRVGRSVYCQTPNKWFPVEPHLGALFLHWFPQLLKNYFVVRFFTMWGLMNKPTRQEAYDAVTEIRLLTKSELRRLFPDAEIRTERFLLLFPKSFIAIRRGAVTQAAAA